MRPTTCSTSLKYAVRQDATILFMLSLNTVDFAVGVIARPREVCIQISGALGHPWHLLYRNEAERKCTCTARVLSGGRVPVEIIQSEGRRTRGPVRHHHVVLFVHNGTKRR